VVVLIANTVDQAKQLLTAHALTLEVAVIHREPQGLELIPFIKSSASLADLPYIIISSEWTDADFARHQQSSEGANAYLREERCAQDLRFVIEQVLGAELSMVLAAPAVATGSVMSGLSLPQVQSAPIEPQNLSGVSVQMEDATSVFQPTSMISPNFSLEVDSSEASRNASASSEGATRVVSRDELEPAPVETARAPEVVVISPEISAQDPIQFASGVSISQMPELPVELVSPVELSAAVASPPVESSPVVALPPIESSPALEMSVVEAQHPSRTPEPAGDPVAELPYLFNQAARPRPAPPVGDAVVPGGAAQSPDVETLKRYLALREQDVAALSAQLHEARRQIRNLESDLRQSHALMEEQGFRLEGKEKREQEFEREKALLIQGLQSEMDELRFQMKTRSDKARSLESQVRETAQEMERLRERVRNDIRKIRVREKELENRLEIVRKDSEALLMAREATILELKRKLDTAEFNLDLMHDRLGREKEGSAELREKLLRASQAVRLAGGLLDPANPDAGTPESSGRSTERPDRKVS
jgi:hypothetical protein